MKKNPRLTIKKRLRQGLPLDVKKSLRAGVNKMLKKSVRMRKLMEQAANQKRVENLAKTGRLEFTKNGKKIRINIPHASVRAMFQAAVKRKLFGLTLSKTDPIITFKVKGSYLGASFLRLHSRYAPMTINLKYFNQDLSGGMVIFSNHKGRKLRTLVSFTAQTFATSTSYVDTGKVASVSPIVKKQEHSKTLRGSPRYMKKPRLPKPTISGLPDNQPERKSYSKIRQKPWVSVTMYNKQDAMNEFKRLVVQCVRSMPPYARGKYVETLLNSAKIKEYKIKGKTSYRVEMVFLAGSRSMSTRFLVHNIWSYFYPRNAKKFNQVTHINQLKLMRNIFQRYYGFVQQVKLREKNKAKIERITVPSDHVYCGIGINTYSAPKVKNLSGCTSDVRLMANSLKSKRRHMATGTVTRQKFVATVRAAVQQSLKLNKACVICYSGHGHVDKRGKFHFSSSDRREKNPRTHLTGAQFYQLIKPLLDRGIKVNVILDCCHAGAFGRRQTHSGLTSLCASQGHKTSLELNGQGSFTHSLAKGLKKHGPTKLGKAFLYSENATAARSYHLGKGFYQETEIYQGQQLAKRKKKKRGIRYA